MATKKKPVRKPTSRGTAKAKPAKAKAKATAKARPARASKASKPKKPVRPKVTVTTSASPVRATPETLRLREASPSFTVNDLEKSLAFYRDVLGFVVEDRWEEDGKLNGVMMLAGSVRLFLGQDDWKKGRDRKKGEGFRIYCTTAQDVDVLAAEIKARGGTLDHDPMDRPWGGRDFAVTDPDGFKLTIAVEPTKV